MQIQAGLGEVFRGAQPTAANPQALGRLEYSVHEWEVPLVVLGHTKCGAVKEAVNIVKNNAIFPATIEAMLLPLLPAGRDGGQGPQGLDPNPFAAAARRRAQGGRRGDDLDTGVVDFFDLPPPPDSCVTH